MLKKLNKIVLVFFLCKDSRKMHRGDETWMGWDEAKQFINHCRAVPEPYSLGYWQNGSWARVRRQGVAHCRPMDLRTRRKRNLLFLWEGGYRWHLDQRRNRNKTKQKILLPALHRGKERRCSRRLLRKSKLQHLRVARVRAASSISWTTWGLAGTRGAPLSCERLDAPAYVSIRPGAERLWRTQEGAHGDGQTKAWPRGAAVDGASRRGRMCWIASVCCCTAENCWAKPSTVSPNSPPWEMGASRKRALSTSFISARLSQRWRSWTTMVDIAFPRDRAVTFVARRAKSVAVRSSCINPGSVLPSCTCLSALAWWTCRIAMACRAEAAWPAAL